MVRIFFKVSSCVTDKIYMPARGPLAYNIARREAIHIPSAGVPNPWRSVLYWQRRGPTRVVKHVRKLDSAFYRWKKKVPSTAVRRSLRGDCIFPRKCSLSIFFNVKFEFCRHKKRFQWRAVVVQPLPREYSICGIISRLFEIEPATTVPHLRREQR